MENRFMRIVKMMEEQLVDEIVEAVEFQGLEDEEEIQDYLDSSFYSSAFEEFCEENGGDLYFSAEWKNNKPSVRISAWGEQKG